MADESVLVAVASAVGAARLAVSVRFESAIASKYIAPEAINTWATALFGVKIYRKSVQTTARTQNRSDLAIDPKLRERQACAGVILHQIAEVIGLPGIDRGGTRRCEASVHITT